MNVLIEEKAVILSNGQVRVGGRPVLESRGIILSNGRVRYPGVTSRDITDIQLPGGQGFSVEGVQITAYQHDQMGIFLEATLSGGELETVVALQNPGNLRFFVQQFCATVPRSRLWLVGRTNRIEDVLDIR